MSPGPGGRRSPGPAAPRAVSRKLAALPSSPRAPGKAGAGPFAVTRGLNKRPGEPRPGQALTSLPKSKTRSFFWPGQRGRNWELGRAGLQLRGRRGEAMGPALSPTGAPARSGQTGGGAPRETKGPAAAATRTEAAGTRPAPPTCGRHTLARAQKSCGLCPRGAGVFRCQEKATVFPSLLGSRIISPSPKPAPCFSCWTLLFFPV